MRTRNLPRLFLLTFFIILMTCSTALSAATQNSSGITISTTEALALIKHHDVLEAQVTELRGSLASERAVNKEILDKLEIYINTSKKQVEILEEQNKFLRKQNIMYFLVGAGVAGLVSAAM